MNINEFNDEELNAIKKFIASMNGKKGAQQKWDRYPKGSPERAHQLEKLLAGTRARWKKHREGQGLDNT